MSAGPGVDFRGLVVFPMASRLGFIQDATPASGAASGSSRPMTMTSRVDGVSQTPLQLAEAARLRALNVNCEIMQACLDLIADPEPAAGAGAGTGAGAGAADAGIYPAKVAHKFRVNLEKITAALRRIRPALPHLENLIRTLPHLLNTYHDLCEPLTEADLILANLFLNASREVSSPAAGAGSSASAVGSLVRLEPEDAFFRRVVEWSAEGPGVFGGADLRAARIRRHDLLNGFIKPWVAALQSKLNTEEGCKNKAKAYLWIINYWLEAYAKIDQEHPKAGISGKTTELLKFRAQFLSRLNEQDYPSGSLLDVKLKEIRVIKDSPVETLLPQFQSLSEMGILYEARRVTSITSVAPIAGSDEFSKLIPAAERIRARCYYQNLLEMIACLEFLQLEKIGETALSELSSKVHEYCTAYFQFSLATSPQEEELRSLVVSHFSLHLNTLLTYSPYFSRVSYQHILLGRSFDFSNSVGVAHTAECPPEVNIGSALLGLTLSASSAGAGSALRSPFCIPISTGYDASLAKYSVGHPVAHETNSIVKLRQLLSALLNQFIDSKNPAELLAQEELAKFLGVFSHALNLLDSDIRSYSGSRDAQFGRCIAITKLYDFLQSEIRRIDCIAPSLGLLACLEKSCKNIGVTLDRERLSPAEYLDCLIERVLEYQRIASPESSSPGAEQTARVDMVARVLSHLLGLQKMWANYGLEGVESGDGRGTSQELLHLTWDEVWVGFCMLFGRDKDGKRRADAPTDHAVRKDIVGSFCGGDFSLIRLLPDSIRPEFSERVIAAFQPENDATQVNAEFFAQLAVRRTAGAGAGSGVSARNAIPVANMLMTDPRMSKRNSANATRHGARG